MKILFALHQFFPQWFTGTEKFVLNNAKQLILMGNQVEVLTYGYLDHNKFEEKNGVLFRKYSYQNIPVTCIKNINTEYHPNFNIFDVSLEYFLDEFLKYNKFDCIHIAHPMRVGTILKSAKKNGFPVVLTLTDFWLICPKVQGLNNDGELCLSPEKGQNCYKKCYPLKKRIELINRYKDAELFLSLVDYIASPSNFLSRVFSNTFYFEFNIVYHGIDYLSIPLKNPRQFYPINYLKIGYIGTILPHKGLHIVINSLKFIPDFFKLYIYGGFYDPKYLKDLIIATKNDPRIIFMGRYNEEDIPNIMDSINMTICPSIWWENSPLTILTSFAYKKPVIGNNIGGCDEFINAKENGLKFIVNNSQDLAKKISYLCQNPQLINEMSTKIRFPKRIEEESYDYYKIYSSLRYKRVLINDEKNNLFF